MQSVILLHSTTTTYHPSPQNLSALYSAVVWLLESGKTGGESRYCFPVGSFCPSNVLLHRRQLFFPRQWRGAIVKYLFPAAVKVEYTILTWREKFLCSTCVLPEMWTYLWFQCPLLFRKSGRIELFLPCGHQYKCTLPNVTLRETSMECMSFQYVKEWHGCTMRMTAGNLPVHLMQGHSRFLL